MVKSIKIYGDGADIEEMRKIAPLVSGFTTNPTLIKKAGVKNYKEFALQVITSFPNHPISLEVFADDFDEMEKQALEIHSWGANVFVKIPVTNTQGGSTGKLITRLAQTGVKVNVTAVFTYDQIDGVLDALDIAPAIISVFAGRIADTGRSPAGFINHALKKKKLTTHEILWASPRQVLDVYTAESLGCDIITVTPEILAKLPLEGKNLKDFSRETVQMFYDDAKAAGYSL